MSKKKKVKWIVWSVVGVMVASVVGYNVYAASNYVPTVKSGSVSHQPIDTYLSTTATIRSTDTTSYFAPPNSKVAELNFKKGDTVRAGDVIASFDMSGLKDEIRLAQLSYADAQLEYNNSLVEYENAQLSLEEAEVAVDRQSEYDEINMLIKDNQTAISDLQTKIRRLERDMADGEATDDKDQLDRYTNRIEILSQENAELSAKLSAYPQIEDKERNVQNQENNLETRKNGIAARKNAMETAAVKLQSLQKYQEDGKLTAEKDGIITELSLVKGAPATDTTVSVVVQNLDALRACFNINKYDIGTIQEGQEATLTLGDTVYHGTVSLIGTTAVEVTSGSNTTAQVPAEITLTDADADIILGLEFDVDIHTYSNTDALAIPVEAVLTDRGGDFCYKLSPTDVKPGAFTYEKVYIQVGKSSDMFVEVLGGIEDGAQVIMNPPTTLETMTIVRPVAEDMMMVNGAGTADPTGGAAASGTASEPATSMTSTLGTDTSSTASTAGDDTDTTTSTASTTAPSSTSEPTGSAA